MQRRMLWLKFKQWRMFKLRVKTSSQFSWRSIALVLLLNLAPTSNSSCSRTSSCSSSSPSTFTKFRPNNLQHPWHAHSIKKLFNDCSHKSRHFILESIEKFAAWMLCLVRMINFKLLKNILFKGKINFLILQGMK